MTASQSGNSETISYAYGNSSTGGTGQMRLISESLNGWTKTYTYDDYGHVTSETMGKTGVISRTKSYTYDSNGLLTASTQPGSKTFAYTYDAYGNLTGVDGAGGAVKWNLTGYTGRRTISETALDNNNFYPFVKTHLLDQYGYLDSIYTVQDDCWYQEDDYNFSPVTGNLLSMKQNWMDYPQTFGYDNLDRLISVSENNESIMNMVYAANGNITSKTGVGSYTYNSSVKPHAVQSVSNTDGLVELEEQDITYNLWGKVSTIWHYDETDFYYYTAEYGPDLEKVSSRYDKTYHIEYEKFQWGDYEEKTTDGVTTCFYFVNGADGLAGLHTVSSTQGGTETHTAAVMTDHLGSITTMADNLDWCYDAHYDVWGNREVQLPFYYSIERGYTGHEQPEGLRLIDMRGRMYDPVLGRFLSPDAFVQAPTDPQNYNRYSYCLNNPLKYTDPSGEIVWTPIIIAAVMGGVQGTMFGLQNGAEGWDMVGYIAGGAALGALSGGMAQGMAAIGATPFVSQLTCNAVTSSLGAGMMSGWNGKSMLMGLGSGLLSGCAFGAISLSSFNYDPVGLINGLLADGVINAATGAFTSGIITAFYGGSIKDVGDAVLNGAIMGAISGVASGAYRGWTNAETLGVNHWTGGTLQERAQAWVDYYGFKDVEVYVLNKENIAKYNNYHGKYRLEKDYLSNKINAYKNGVIKPSPIDGITRIQYHQIYFTKASVRHASFSSSWGAGTFWHEYYHVLTQDINEFIPYQKGLQYGGISYYWHCMDYPDFAQYGFVKPHR